MKTGFRGLDEIIDIGQSQLILLTDDGFSNIDLLSGDIANYVQVVEKKNVLEVVSCRKEAIIKRLLINQAKIEYNKWSCYQYTDEELVRLGKQVTRLIDTTEQVPTIVEQELGLYNLKNVKKAVKIFLEEYEGLEKLVILDIYPLQLSLKSSINKSTCTNFIKSMRKISHKLDTTIIIAAREDRVCKTKKYADKVIEVSNSKEIRDIKVYERSKLLGTCKLKYDTRHRCFVDYKD